MRSSLLFALPVVLLLASEAQAVLIIDNFENSNDPLPDGPSAATLNQATGVPFFVDRDSWGFSPGNDGQASVSPFTLLTENDPEFSKLFQLELSTFRDTIFEEVSVREFKLEYVIRRGGSEDD